MSLLYLYCDTDKLEKMREDKELLNTWVYSDREMVTKPIDSFIITNSTCGNYQEIR